MDSVWNCAGAVGNATKWIVSHSIPSPVFIWNCAETVGNATKWIVYNPTYYLTWPVVDLMKWMIYSNNEDSVTCTGWFIAPFIIKSGFLTLADVLIKHYSFKTADEVGMVEELYIQPIRGLRPVPLSAWDLDKTGFLHNKRIAIYDKPRLSRVNTSLIGHENLGNVIIRSLREEELVLVYGDMEIVIPYAELENCQTERITLQSIQDGMEYLSISEELDTLMSEALFRPVAVLYNPTHKVDGSFNYPVLLARGNRPVAVPPVLVISENSIRDLEERTGRQVEMERFRPNLVVSGAEAPNAEDYWHTIQVGENVVLEAIWNTPRCGKINNLQGQIDNTVYDVVRNHAPRDSWDRPCIGTYFRVIRPGTINEGDRIVVHRRLDNNLSEPPNNVDNHFIMGF